MDIANNQTIKGYELRDRIGTGGFGVVYRAYQTTVGREVAIKIILPDLANQPEFIRRFEGEAQLVARLEHPHITPLNDYWRDPSGAYLVMRWLRGGSLRDALGNGPFELRATTLLLDQIVGALSLAHRHAVIHRDIKPGNILLDEDGNAYLTDFGIAKDLNLPGTSTQQDAIVGSLDYLSPEQARGATGWRRVKAIMQTAVIDADIDATPKRLRYGLGVAAVASGVPLNLVKNWLGHARLSTTAIYAEAVGDEEKEIAAKIW